MSIIFPAIISVTADAKQADRLFYFGCSIFNGVTSIEIDGTITGLMLTTEAMIADVPEKDDHDGGMGGMGMGM